MNQFNGIWNVEENQSNQIPLARFQQELLQIDSMYQYQAKFEEEEDQSQYQEEESGKQDLERFNEYKGQGKSTKDLFEEMFLKQSNQYDESQSKQEEK